MKIPVLVEPVAGNGYRARALEFAISAEGATEDEAVRKYQELIQEKLKAGARVFQIEVAEQDNPWLRMAGTLDLNDPLVKEWIEIMEENRQKADEDPDFL
ncbi:MAG TPA: hypothetical protein VNK04_01890 [Gemmataceae bacterium]|nr:hypothetical protein [Gemmataceae bacterium]